MRVLVADKFESSGLDGLKKLGVEVVYEAALQDEALGSRIRESEANILIVRGTKVNADMMEGSRLGLIIRAGAGYNTIDVAGASARGIMVSNCPGKNGLAVAELAFGLILACDRHIPDNVADIRRGKWNKKEFSKARGLYGRTLGLIGMGNIGQEMITRAKAFGMHVVSFSRWMTPDVAAALGIGRANSLEDLARMSDVVSVHVALTPQTKGMLGKSFFDAMPEGSIFVNTSRGEVVDEAAMVEALDRKKMMAGLDVFAGEPTGGEGEFDGPLKDNPRVYITHHIGAGTDQAQEAVADETVRIVKEYMLSGNPPNTVNVGKSAVSTHLLIVRHLDKAGVLAEVLTVIEGEGACVQEMENIVLGGAKSAIAQIALDREPSSKAVDQIRHHACVFDASCMPIASA